MIYYHKSFTKSKNEISKKTTKQGIREKSDLICW